MLRIEGFAELFGTYLVIPTAALRVAFLFFGGSGFVRVMTTTLSTASG